MTMRCLLAAGLALWFVPGAWGETARKRAERALAALAEAKDPRARAAAIEEIGKVGQIQKSLVASAFEQVREALSDASVEVRRAAATAYGRLDPDPKEAVPRLVKLLKEDADEEVKIAAARGLALLGPAARDALPVFRSLLAEERKKQEMNKGQQSRLQRELNGAVQQIRGR